MDMRTTLDNSANDDEQEHAEVEVYDGMSSGPAWRGPAQP
jgi:hypothetical protein